MILVRLAWVMFYRATLARRWSPRGSIIRRSQAVASPKGGLIISWCGMRGLVTLATAFALPENFPVSRPHRLLAFAVVLGTLVIQGLTLRPLILAFGLKDDDPVGNEVARARAVAYRAALDAIEGDPSEEAEILRLEYRAILMQAGSDPNGGIASGELPADPLRRRAIAAARKSIFELRANRSDRRRCLPPARRGARSRRIERGGMRSRSHLGVVPDKRAPSARSPGPNHRTSS